MLFVVQYGISHDVTFVLLTICRGFEQTSVPAGWTFCTKVIRVSNKDEPCFDDQCRYDFGLKQEAHLRWSRDRTRVNWKSLSAVK